ncbi:MAG: hypothetical protein ABR499_17830 [Gemmatimonadaceae bacterium]
MTDVHAAAHRQQPTREQAQQIREQAQAIRERAQAIREQAEQRREELEAAREAREAEREAAQAVRIEVPPPPPPPGQEPQIVIRPPRPWEHEPGIPGEVVDIVGMLTFGTAAVLILRPLMRAFANRFERRGMPPTVLPPEVTAQMELLEQAIEAVAIEVERISEGQRYTTKLLSDRAGKQG